MTARPNYKVRLNEYDKGKDLSLSIDRLTAYTSGGAHNFVRATHGVKTGKWYFEFPINDSNSLEYVDRGIASQDATDVNTCSLFYQDTNVGTSGRLATGTGVGYSRYSDGSTRKTRLGWTLDFGEAVTQTPNLLNLNIGSVIRVLLNLDEHQVSFYVNASYSCIRKNLPAKYYYPALGFMSYAPKSTKASINFGENGFSYPINSGYTAYYLAGIYDNNIGADRLRIY